MSETRVLRIAMNGITGRMGYRQHLLRSILPIRDQGGITLPDGSKVTVEPILVGRNEAKVRELARKHHVEEWTTDLQAVIDDPSVDIVFDASMTSLRAETLEKAMRAGKHIFTEKPTAETLGEAVALAQIAQERGITAGVVHDKLYLPGLVKLRRLVEEGFFGRILSLRGEFGYWVFEGEHQEAQRPSWNYRLEDGGSMTTDMYCHWNYVLEGIVGTVKSVTSKSVTHIPSRWDEKGEEYLATADDAAYGVFELETPDGDPVVAQINSSWAVRVYRDELVEFQVDGTHGSAVAGLNKCVAQQRAHTPKPVWNPDLPVTESFREQWMEVPANAELDNGFKLQWEEFLADVVAGREHRYGLLSAARGVQLAELGLQSSAERRTVDIPEITLASTGLENAEVAR
ncbi:Gfo/Idh/MocA family oxidoreductase [Cellulosimicrobium funkei]|nr:Gfo/Idh/MocA family oxidoreductase [Cellulosimicrobium funkei]